MIMFFLLIFSFILDRKYYKLYSDRVKENIPQTGKIISDLIISGNLEEILSKNYLALNGALVTLMNLYPKIIDARIYDRDYQLISAPVAKIDITRHKYIQKIMHPINIGKTHLGHIEMWVDFSQEMADLKKFQIFSSAFLAIFICAGAASFFWIYCFLIKKPLTDLGVFLDRVTGGSRSERLPAGNDLDEIGKLRIGSNRLFDSLMQRENDILAINRDLKQKSQAFDQLNKDLKAVRNGLEYEIKNRTASLKEANIALASDQEAILNILEDLDLMNNQLKAAQEKLVQSAKMAAIGQLAGGVAHEINNPLTGVLNNIQLIKMELAGKKECNTADFMEIIDVIEDSGIRCKRIVQSLLDFSRIGTKEHRMVAINEVVKNTLTLAENDIQLRNIKIIKQFSDGLPSVSANLNQFEQVFLNIFNNAKWAMRDKNDDGELKIKTFLSHDDKYAVIEISDNGCGITKENLPRIFEPFFTTKPPGKGTGLGLSICYGIIKEQGGDIKVSSAGTDKGSTFTISLPVAK